jgi:hypothetical protein
MQGNQMQIQQILELKAKKITEKNQQLQQGQHATAPWTKNNDC